VVLGKSREPLSTKKNLGNDKRLIASGGRIFKLGQKSEDIFLRQLVGIEKSQK
jgi:hypothetical protein